MIMNPKSSQAVDLAALATQIRMHSLRMVHSANASHIGSCFSMVDLLAVLYGRVLRVDPARPDWPERDRFILSKGHAAASLYAVLAEIGFFAVTELDAYAQHGSQLTGHISHYVPGVEVSTGSLGHGLPIGCGIALASKRTSQAYRTFVLLSDGELDEGSNWEAILFAPQHKLDNLVAIVDFNQIQSFGFVKDVIDLDPLAAKWAACNWAVEEVDGHDHAQIEAVLARIPFVAGRPSVVIAHTIKGKGVSYMEDLLKWHYSAPNADQLALALQELGV